MTNDEITLALLPETRPWTRWWWMGSALDEAEITRHMELFHAAGIGGVEISPIYGSRGYEERFVPFLNDRWIALLAFTLHEGQRLGMGVDMIAGTGWPYGGPWVHDSDAPQKMVWKNASALAPGETPVAVSDPDAKGHRLALLLAPTGQQVKRAAPGGEGNVVNPFSAASVRHYLDGFDRPLSRLPHGEMVRCVFNDSYEVFGANATPDMLTEFSSRRGYALAPHLRALHGEGDKEIARRVRADYRETLGDLIRDAFVGTWTSWAREHGARTRNQAHGSPGNILDLYAAADIPETEAFGPASRKIGGGKALLPAPPEFGEEEEPLMCRFASSAAHVAGKPLCSSESFTWLGEHGAVALSHAKAELDTLFTCGINHIFFHGTPFSPADVPWPGWLFYATTHMAPTNTWWRDFAVLNAYITRCQSHLQAGLPDNNVLLYFPYHDLLHGDAGAVDDLQFMTVHRTAAWLRGNLPDFVRATHTLTDGGWSYDLVSDRQLATDIAVHDGALHAATGGARYSVLLVAGCTLMSPATLDRIVALADAGATVLVLGDLPADVPGLADLDARRARIANTTKTLRAHPHVRIGSHLDALLDETKTLRESLAPHGIAFTRRRAAEGARTYFLSNSGARDYADWTTLASPPPAPHVFDPMTGTHHPATTRTHADGQTEIFLSLPAGASLILAPQPSRPMPFQPTSTPGIAAGTTTREHPLDGPWTVAFVEGGPTLPAARQIDRLSDWTTWDAPDAHDLRAFSGTARYTHTFDAPTGELSANAYALDLGDVCHSARVRLNGTDIGTVIARPWRVSLPAALLRPTGNTLEIEVTNLMANRLIDLERQQGDAWRPFLMVTVEYKPFHPADWPPLPSGLLGPVRLVGE